MQSIEKQWKMLRIDVKLNFFKKILLRKIIKQQSELTFNGIHKPYTKHDSYTFKQNEDWMEKPIYLGYVLLELRKLLMYETFFYILQPYFGQDRITITLYEL